MFKRHPSAHRSKPENALRMAFIAGQARADAAHAKGGGHWWGGGNQLGATAVGSAGVVTAAADTGAMHGKRALRFISFSAAEG